MICSEKEQLLFTALEESQSLFAAMLHENRPKSEIEEQMAQNRKVIEAARRAPAVPATHEPPFWFPHLQDLADGVAGHYSIARRNPGKNFLEYISPLGNWVGYGAQVFSLEEAQGWMKNSALAAAPRPPACNPSMQPELATYSAPVQLPEPVAKVEKGGLKWHIPDIGYSLPVHYSQGTHYLYTEQQVRDILAQYGIN